MDVRKAVGSGMLFLAVLLTAPMAVAQAVRVTGAARESQGGVPEPDAGTPGLIVTPTGMYFNYADCAADSQIAFSLAVDDPNLANDRLVVLAGPSAAACIPAAGKSGVPTGCWPVAKTEPLQPTMTVKVRARDVTAYLGSATLPTSYTPQTDPATACHAQTCPGPVSLELVFLIEGTNNEVPAAEQPAAYGPLLAGTLGPQAPQSVVAAVGTGYVTLTWTPPTESAIYGYYVYCQNFGRIDAAVPDGSGSSAPDACTDGQAGCVNGFDAGAPIGACPTKFFTSLFTTPSCTGTTTPSADSGSAATDAATAADTGSFIPSEAASSGPVTTSAGISQVPPSFLCASPNDVVDGAATLGQATTTATVSATNFDFYVFAVAAVDKIGNVGAIGDLQCGTPGPIKDFWYNYSTLDGGLAGGGYCALEGVGMPAGSACMTAGVGLAAVGLIRRRRRKAR